MIWFVGDFGHSCNVSYRIREWKNLVPWTEEVLAPDAAEREAGEGDVALLMVHGFGDSLQTYRKLMPEPAQNGYHCKAILLPGFGKDVDTYVRQKWNSGWEKSKTRWRR